MLQSFALSSSVGSFKLSRVNALGYVLGVAVIAAALAAYLTGRSLSGLWALLEQLFTPGFVLGYGVLSAVAVYAGSRLSAREQRPQVLHFWHQAGLQSASGVATLALTFTLLGISLGIGTLAEQALTVESVTPMIQQLTQHFATAFMTSVLGLPSAAVLRAWVSLRAVQCEPAENAGYLQLPWNQE